MRTPTPRPEPHAPLPSEGPLSGEGSAYVEGPGYTGDPGYAAEPLSAAPLPRAPKAPVVDRIADAVLSVQRPLVLAHLRRLRKKHPHATPTQLVRILERRYLAAVTSGGAAVGTAAAVPGVGTAAALALSSAETAGFLEATSLYAQSLAELHGIAIADPDRARILVLTLLIGDEGLLLLRQVSGQAKGGSTRRAFWGEIASTALPRQFVAPVIEQLKTLFLRKAVKTGSASVIGKAIPFGVGAVIGATGNHVLARRVVARSRSAFGIAPALLPPHVG